mgnify:CR=1 FL=1
MHPELPVRLLLNPRVVREVASKFDTFITLEMFTHETDADVAVLHDWIIENLGAEPYKQVPPVHMIDITEYWHQWCVFHSWRRARTRTDPVREWLEYPVKQPTLSNLPLPSVVTRATTFSTDCCKLYYHLRKYLPAINTLDVL